MNSVFNQWAVVEIMGHQSVAGRCSEEQIAGSTLLRVDIPHGDSFTTQYIGGGSIYRMTVVTEEVARQIAARRRDHEPPFQYMLERSLLPDPDDDAGN